MNFDKIIIELQPEILQAEKNDKCKMMLDNANNLGGEAKNMVKGMIAIAYAEGLKDGFVPNKETSRI